jgi:CarD family transcriptional regulator
MKKVVLELKEGDYIVHATHGVGEIMGIESKKLQDEKHVYYTVKTEKLTYWLELVESKSARIRSVCAPATFTKALSVMRREPKPLSNNFRTRIRNIKDEMVKCSVIANARLIRDLHARNAEKNLHVNEHRTMDKLKNQFASEWAVSADIDKSEAVAEMEKALSISIEKLIAQESV